jgi:hypothetical protein
VKSGAFEISVTAATVFEAAIIKAANAIVQDSLLKPMRDLDDIFYISLVAAFHPESKCILIKLELARR